MIDRPLSRRGLGAALCAGAALALAGCATVQAPYHPATPGVHGSEGYSEVRLSQDRYRVTFSGDAFTSRDRVEGYLLFRSAELTLQQGYDWFRVVDRETEREIVREPAYDPWYGSSYSYWRPSWRYYGRPYGWRDWSPWVGDPFWTSRLDMRTVEHWEATAEIVMSRGSRPSGDGRAFDAREVIDRLGPTIQRPGYGA
ncbi:MAG: hypothetical protein QME55_02165 [Brevundimonas sp.]|uniref:CC0125/CC1285 family lipoprotein n=2 Tax=Brevundimonas sp. TaxID=1871086 RepID=UPI00261337C2|nr:hypothetical protein [Brevundimonas sp.]MDI6623510.1 hypothetical protein [Brevundimonas sp.]